MDARLKGQEISIRAIRGGVVVDSIDSISVFNQETMLELKQDGFLGETVNRFDSIFNGFGGDFEFHVHNNRWVGFERSIIDKANRNTPDTVFNVIRTDFYPNGNSTIYTYRDVSWGAIPHTVGSRGDYAKIKAQFQCSERPEQVNNLP